MILGKGWWSPVLAGVWLMSAALVEAKETASGLQWGAALPVHTFYDSNIFHAANSPVEDIGTRVSPSLFLGYKRHSWSLGVDGGWMRERFFGALENSPAQDRQSWDGAAAGSVNFATGLALGSRYKYIDTEEPVYSELEQDRAPVRRFRHQATGNIGQKLGAGRLDTTLTYQFIADRYAALANQVLDSNNQVLELKATVKAFPKTAFFAQTDAGFRRYLARTRLISENHNDVGLNGGMVGEWSPKFKGTIMLGGKVYVFETAGIQLVPTVKLDLTYTPNALSELNAGYEHILLDSTSTIYFNVDRLRLGMTRKLSRSWEFYAVSKLGYLRYSDPFPRADLTFLGGAGFLVKPVPWPQLEIDLRYGYDYRDSEVARFRYISQNIGVELLWKL